MLPFWKSITVLKGLKLSRLKLVTVFPSLILSELREDNCPPSTYLVDGVKALISALKTWLKREVRNSAWLHLTCLQSTWFLWHRSHRRHPRLVLSVSSRRQILCSLLCFECKLLRLCRWTNPPARYQTISGRTISLKNWPRKSAT